MFSHNFECRRIDKRDDKNRLVSTGVEWTEHNTYFENFGIVLFALVCVAGLLVCVIGIVMTASPAASFKGVTVVAAGIWLVWFAYTFMARPVKGMPRSVLFHRDGRVEYEHGLPWWPKVKEASAPHTEITSIEARQSTICIHGPPYDQGVVVYRRNGDIVEIGMSLSRDEAHKVAVQLMQALTAMREDLTSLETRRSSYKEQVAAFSGPSQRGKRATVVIE